MLMLMAGCEQDWQGDRVTVVTETIWRVCQNWELYGLTQGVHVAVCSVLGASFVLQKGLLNLSTVPVS